MMQFPHCDSRVLHSPTECEYCDRHGDWQFLREVWGIAFTGHPPKDGQVACPADRARPSGAQNDHQRWPGNVARPTEAVVERQFQEYRQRLLEEGE